MKDFKELNGKEIRIRRYGYGRVTKIGKETFTFKVPVDDMKWESLELDLKFLKHAKLVKNSELDNKRFRISSITKNFYSKLLSWTGRSTRCEFFFGRLNSLLILLIPSGVLGYFIMVNPPRREFVYAAICLIVLGVLTFAGTISLSARRLQDLGYKGIYSLIFYTIVLSLVSYGLWTLEEPLIFTSVMGVIYLIFEILLVFTISDFDNKYGPCPIARLDDEDENKKTKKEKKPEIKKEGAYTNLKEFTEKVKKDNEEKEEQIKREEKIKEAEKRLLEKQKIEKEKRKEEEKKREDSSESLKDLSERIRKETRSELEKNPDKLRKLPEKEEAPENDFLAEMIAIEKLEAKRLLKEYEEQFKTGEISKEEFERLKKDLEK